MTGIIHKYEIAIIIPAYNEARVIGETLRTIAGGKPVFPDHWQVLVAANGCRDDTIAMVRDCGLNCVLLDIVDASKPNALRTAAAMVDAPVTVVMDADIRLSVDNLEKLIKPLQEGDAERPVAAIGSMKSDISASSWLVRLFYEVWQHNPYFEQGKFGGCYALTSSGMAVLLAMPDVINDDEYIARSVAKIGRVASSDAIFMTNAPRTLKELYHVRTRIKRGNRQLYDMRLGNDGSFARKRYRRFLRKVLCKPSLWLAFLVYTAVNAMACLSARQSKHHLGRWERAERV
tara:strand:+ start:356 stop:1222 length:867 start_codon:yes stop_codon:yes gene_type:complete